MKGGFADSFNLCLGELCICKLGDKLKIEWRIFKNEKQDFRDWIKLFNGCWNDDAGGIGKGG